MTCLTLSLAALLAACEVQPLPPDPSSEVAPLPPEVCRQVKQALDLLQSKGALVYTDKGEATIDQEAWFAMGNEVREQFAQTLGFHAACSAPAPTAEQSVLIRNEEGAPLLQRTVVTSANLGDLLGNQVQ